MNTAEKQGIQVLKRSLQNQGMVITDSIVERAYRDLVSNDIPVSKKEMKKARQQFNREATKMFKGYGQQLSERISNLNDILKKRPRYFPKFLWAWGASIFIDVEKVNKPLAKSE